jgi:type II secretory pathway component PulM
MALSARDRRAAILGSVGLGLIGLYLLAIEPLAKAYEDLVSDHERLAAKVARTIRDNRKAEYFAERLADYEQTAGELSPPRPYDEQITTVGEQITAAAQQSGIQLQGFTPTSAVPWGEDPALELALFHIDAQTSWQQVTRAAASWENVFKFIASLYRIPGVLSIERLDLSSVASKGGPSEGGPDGPGKGGKITLRLTVSVLVKAASKNEGPWAR